MKRIISITVIALLTSLSINAAMSTSRVRKEGRFLTDKKADPKERAERMTERMAKEYNLNEKQKQQLLKTNLKMAEAKQKQADKKREAKQAKMEQMKAERAQYNAQLKKIMTDKQYQAYQKDLQKHGKKGKRPHRSNGQRGGERPHHRHS